MEVRWDGGGGVLTGRMLIKAKVIRADVASGQWQLHVMSM